MRKLGLFTLLGLFSLPIMAESTRSIWMTDIPRQCYAEDIIQEIPMLMSNYEILEVLDVTNVETIERTKSRLVCSAVLVADNGRQKQYKITFTQNSMGDVIVSY
ncbi:hypothetical protein BMT54_06870 [Pasteurellaceae bacterium 15-036681]|nr:hypothetical protein BMT54_06870 [Pasteurellaceae bacterium 15-036681]